MVNTDQFPFVIELAAFAAKRDFLNLDKWTTDKMKAHQVTKLITTFGGFYAIFSSLILLEHMQTVVSIF